MSFFSSSSDAAAADRILSSLIALRPSVAPIPAASVARFQNLLSTGPALEDWIWLGLLNYATTESRGCDFDVVEQLLDAPVKGHVWGVALYYMCLHVQQKTARRRRGWRWAWLWLFMGTLVGVLAVWVHLWFAEELFDVTKEARYDTLTTRHEVMREIIGSLYKRFGERLSWLLG